VQTDLDVSRWEVWAAGVDRTNDDNRPESSGNMPVMNEDLARNWASPAAVWPKFAVNLRTLDAGDWVLVLKMGKKAGYDDAEARSIYLELYGVTEAAGVS